MARRNILFVKQQNKDRRKKEEYLMGRNSNQILKKALVRFVKNKCADFLKTNCLIYYHILGWNSNRKDDREFALNYFK
jgi:hypothetical protein